MPKILSIFGGQRCYWPLSQESLKGAAYADLCPGAADFTAYNTPTAAVDRMGHSEEALEFVLANLEYLEAVDNALHSIGDGATDNPFSLSFWAKITATSTLYVGKGILNTLGEWTFQATSGGTLRFRVFDESVDDCWIGRSASSIVTLNTWLNYIATYDGSGASSGVAIHVSGAQVDTADDESAVISFVASENLGAGLRVGRYDTSYSSAILQQLRLWGRVLTAAEIEFLAKFYP